MVRVGDSQPARSHQEGRADAEEPRGRILTWFASPISNGVVEGFNSRIQSIKSAARGFRIFEHYRNRILFYCGKLTLKPSET